MGIKLWAVRWERDIPNYTYIVKSITPWDRDDPTTHGKGQWVISAVDELDAFKQFNQWKAEKEDQHGYRP